MVVNLILFCIFNLVAFSDITVSKNKLSLGETFVLEVDNEDNISGLEHFTTISRGSSKFFSSSKVVSTEKYTLAPRSVGKFEIKSANKTIIINVEDNQEAPQSYIKIEDLPEEVYAGEKFIAKYYLLSTRDIASAKFRTMFDRSDVNSKLFPFKGGPVEEGSGYLKYPLDRVVYELSNVGTTSIPMRVLDLEILNSRSFYGIYIPAHISSKEIEVKVKELPKRENFSNIVGELKGEYVIDRNRSIESDDTFSIKIKLYGNVNLDSLNRVYSDVDGFKVFDNMTSSSEDIIDDKYYSEKEFEILFSPTKSGELTIPKVLIEYFSVVDEEYRSFEIPEVKIDVHLVEKDITTIVIEDKGVGIVSIISKYRVWISVIILIVISFILRYTIFIIFNSKVRSTLLAIARERDEDKLFNILVNFIKDKRGLDIESLSLDEIRGSFEEVVADKIIHIRSAIDAKKMFGVKSEINLKVELINLIKLL